MLKTHCKHGHLFETHGTWVQSANHHRGARLCVTCRKRRKHEVKRRAAGLDGSALATNESFASLRMRQVWEARRQKWPTGISAEGLASLHAKRLVLAERSMMCRRGHRWTTANSLMKQGKRYCRACIARGRGRAKWATLVHARTQREIAEVRRQIVKHHPDRGGRGGPAYRRAIRRYAELRAVA
jgi:hypothetical protein